MALAALLAPLRPFGLLVIGVATMQAPAAAALIRAALFAPAQLVTGAGRGAQKLARRQLGPLCALLMARDGEEDGDDEDEDEDEDEDKDEEEPRLCLYGTPVTGLLCWAVGVLETAAALRVISVPWWTSAKLDRDTNGFLASCGCTAYNDKDMLALVGPAADAVCSAAEAARLCGDVAALHLLLPAAQLGAAFKGFLQASSIWQPAYEEAKPPSAEGGGGHGARG